VQTFYPILQVISSLSCIKVVEFDVNCLILLFVVYALRDLIKNHCAPLFPATWELEVVRTEVSRETRKKC
jgi:hypothetical protein